MMSDEIQIGVFSSEKDSNLYEYRLKIERVRDELLKFGLSGNQAKVFIYLGKYGPKSAPEIFKSLGLPRTETYYILNVLQSRGIITAECSFPTKYFALPIEQAISTLINVEQEKLNTIAKEEKNITQLWKEIPTFAVETTDTKAEKLQMMEGAGQIHARIKEMIKGAKEQVIIFGNASDFSRFYHSDILETLPNAIFDTKLTISCASQIPDFLSEFDKNKLRLAPSEKNNNRCYVIKDNNEVMLFLRNATHASHNIFAIWTDSRSVIDSMQELFNYTWDLAETCY